MSIICTIFITGVLVGLICKNQLVKIKMYAYKMCAHDAYLYEMGLICYLLKLLSRGLYVLNLPCVFCHKLNTVFQLKDLLS